MTTLPSAVQTRIELDHGAGGRLSQELVTFIVEALGPAHTGLMEDSAVLPVESARIAMTTDSFVVDPYIFGNGDIGKIAVAGTVNDLAVVGATPRYLTLGVILEEGFPFSDLEVICRSVGTTAAKAGVSIVAGDTKVVRKGEVDGIFLNTAGVGTFDIPSRLSSRFVSHGDALVVTGPLGDHSIHLLSLREGLGFESRVLSDCAPLNHVTRELLTRFGEGIHTMRDVTRGGLGTVLNELAQASGVEITIDEESLPVGLETRMAAEMLGVDVKYLANEGVLCLAVAPEIADEVLACCAGIPETRGAAIVGRARVSDDSRVVDRHGVRIDMLAGAQLPRLC